jgi:hypothetical protein
MGGEGDTGFLEELFGGCQSLGALLVIISVELGGIEKNLGFSYEDARLDIEYVDVHRPRLLNQLYGFLDGPLRACGPVYR